MHRAIFITLPTILLGCAMQNIGNDFFSPDNPNNIRVLTEVVITTHCKGEVETEFSISRINGFLLPYDINSGYLSVSAGHFEVEGICTHKGRVPCEGTPVKFSKQINLVAEIEPNKKYNLIAGSGGDYTMCALQLSEAKP